MMGDTLRSLSELVSSRDYESIALHILHDLDNLGPLDVPPLLPQSDELHEATKKPGSTADMPKLLKAEFDAWHARLWQRAEAKGENVRRLRTTLWAEQWLRQHGRGEHEVLRAFNRDMWGVAEPASADLAIRTAQERVA